uniref:Polygalacturonase n=1 Tax=Cannabis sativa TaxID=3483 RepID=A0A803PGM8_CANSA
MGLRKRIGSGSTVRITEDPWLPIVNRPTPVPITHVLENFNVSSLFQVDSIDWDVNVVRDLFSPTDAAAILGIPISYSTHGDTWEVLKQMWAEKVPPKSKDFIWRAASKCLSTKTNLCIKKALWSARNDIVWKQRIRSVIEVVMFANSTLDQWLKAQGKGNIPSLSPIQQATAGCKIGRVSPELAEIMGIREALSWIKTNDYSQVVIEADSRVCVEAIRSSAVLVSAFGLAAAVGDGEASAAGGRYPQNVHQLEEHYDENPLEEDGEDDDKKEYKEDYEEDPEFPPTNQEHIMEVHLDGDVLAATRKFNHPGARPSQPGNKGKVVAGGIQKENFPPRPACEKPNLWKGRSTDLLPQVPPHQPPSSSVSNIFNVLSFGAKGDGVSDDSKALLAAWEGACKVSGATVIIPSKYKFLIKPIILQGPCMPHLIFQIDGTLLAPPKIGSWQKYNLFQWIYFKWINNFTIQGTGVVDGQGSNWWCLSQVYNTQKKSKYIPDMKPTALRFYSSNDVTVKNIKIINSPQCHLKFDSSKRIKVDNITISSPENSPNTDGIHLQNSQDVEIHHSNIGCGDDCVSIQTGCSNVHVHHINCGPGHDQYYCDKNTYCKNQSGAVGISGIKYDKIIGTFSAQPIHLACSKEIPCIDVDLIDIQLSPSIGYNNRGLLKQALCSNSYGKSEAPLVPSSIDYCLRSVGGPVRRTERSHEHICSTGKY